MTDQEQIANLEAENRALRENIKSLKDINSLLTKTNRMNEKEINEYKIVNANLNKQLMVQESAIQLLKQNKIKEA